MSEENNVESHTIALLREIRGDIAGLREEMNGRFAKVDARFDGLESHITASDEENAKALAQILQHTANVNELLIDLQARVVRHENRIKKLEETRPEV